MRLRTVTSPSEKRRVSEFNLQQERIVMGAGRNFLVVDASGNIIGKGDWSKCCRVVDFEKNLKSNGGLSIIPNKNTRSFRKHLREEW